MIIFILISILFSQHNYTEKDFNPDNYYCKSNYALKIFKLSDEELIFYGTEGGILRTYDGGKTWHQNYTGLHNTDEILNLVELNGTIYGVTKIGKIIKSDDKGDYWKTIYQEGYILSGIAKIGNDLYVSTSTNTIFVSSDFGESWITHRTNLGVINHLYAQDDKLIAVSKNRIEIFNRDLSIFRSLIYIIPVEKTYFKFDNFYYNSKTSIAKLNSDFEWEIFNIFEEERQFSIYPEGDNIKIFTHDMDSIGIRFFQFFNYSTTNQEITSISEYKTIYLDFRDFHKLSYQILDIEKTNNSFLFSGYLKTIIRVSPQEVTPNYDWEVVSYSRKYDLPFTSNSINKFYLGDGNNSYLISTKDRGNTFNLTPSPYYIDSTTHFARIDTIIPYVQYAFEVDSLNGFVIFKDSGRKNFYTNFTAITANSFCFGKTNDGFKSIDLLDIKISGIKILGIKNNEVYFTRHLAFDQHGTPKGFYSTYLYKINMLDYKLDTIFVFEDSLKSVNLYFDDDKIWAVGANDFTYKNIKLFLSEDNGETFELKQTFKFNSKIRSYYFTDAHIIRNTSNDLYLINFNQFIKINEDDFSYEINDFEKHIRILNYDFTKKYFDELIFSFNDIIDSTWSNITYVGEIEIKVDDFIFNDFSTIGTGTLFPFFFEDGSILMRSTDGFNKFYFPIEPERLEYYSSVQKTEKRNYLWTYPPYPQPTNNIVKIDTYWDSALPFTEEHIEIYNLTGIKINTTNKLSIQKESNYNGQIIWDASNQQPGIYILKINHGTETRVRKIMVVE